MNVRALRTVRTALLATLLGVAAAQSSPTDAQLLGPDDLPVVRMVLGTAGVATFEHEGTVQGDRELVLDWPLDAMDDLLQSLVVQDLDGGTVGSVTYTARDPLDRILGGYAFDLRDAPDLARLLQQARGATVVVQGPDGLATGPLVAVERDSVGEARDAWHATVRTERGLTRVPLTGTTTVRFQDPDLQAELDAALAELARDRGEDRTEVRIRFDGEGERRVRLSYVREMPIFKTGWRLVAGDDGEAALQGWAIVDNPTDLDLRGIELVLLAGRPIAFVTELLEPVHVPRQRLAPPVATQRAPDADAGVVAEMGADAVADAMPAAPAPMMARSAPQLEGAGVRAAAEAAASDGGVAYAYRLRDPVDLERHRSALIPIVQATVPAERVVTVRPTGSDATPYAALRIENVGDALLPAGTVTIYAEDGFAGNALLGDVPPGGERLLRYAADPAVRTAVDARRETEQVVGVRTGGGNLITDVRTRDTTVYRIARDDAAARTLIVEHPFRSDWEWVAPAPTPERDEDHWRVRVDLADADGGSASDAEAHLACAPNEECLLEVVLERTEARTIRISDQSPDRIEVLLRNVDLSDTDRRALEEIVALQRDLADLDAELRDLRTRRDDAVREQERLRESLAVVPAGEPLHRRYLDDLESWEDRLNDLRLEIEALEDGRSELQAELTEAVRTFGDGI